ncbi:DUF3574 domain-containing protein [Streptomyces sp. NPDC002851]
MTLAAHTSRRTRLAVAVAGVALSAFAVGAPAAYASLDDSPKTGAPRTSAAKAEGEAYVETRLFFGTERPDGGPDVTEQQFLRFIDREVTPRFPDGLTVQEGRGQWRDASGTIERERSYELILLYPKAEAPARDKQVEQIRTAYMHEYGQESVARLDDRLTADF